MKLQSTGLRRRSFQAMAGALVASIALMPLAGTAIGQDRIKAEWWFALGGRLQPIVEELVANYNKSQDKFEIVAVHKGNYEETSAAMVAATMSCGVFTGPRSAAKMWPTVSS